MKKYILHLLVFLAFVVFPRLSWAEDCNNLSNNSHWMSGMEELSRLYAAGNYEQVIKTGKKLLEICSYSPTLNYFIAKAYHEQGDSQKELYYLQIGTRNSEYMEVKADLLERMWKERLYLEFPDVSPVAVEQLKSENERLKSQIMSDKLSASDDNSEAIFHYKTMMWSGVGVGSAGVVMLAAGAALVALQNKDAVEFKNPDNPTAVRVSDKYTAGWTLIGAGVTAAVVGVALAGISAYYLSKTKQDEMISFGISLNSAGMVVTF